MQGGTEKSRQIQPALSILRGIVGDGLLAIYLHGSAASGTLRPQSDIDILAVVRGDLTENQRADLLVALMRLSGRHPATTGGPRCLEVIVFRRSDLVGVASPARAEFVYGEWLRESFEAGAKSVPTHDPEYTLLLAQARQNAIPLFGPDAAEFLSEVSMASIRHAMRDLLPALLDGLHGDERNVLLTLARIWGTASTGTFLSKDGAALWAIPQLDTAGASMLDYARQAYLGEIADDWSGQGDAVQHLGKQLVGHINRAM